MDETLTTKDSNNNVFPCQAKTNVGNLLVVACELQPIQASVLSAIPPLFALLPSLLAAAAPNIYRTRSSLVPVYSPVFS